jgi:hypothetical protein
MLENLVCARCDGGNEMLEILFLDFVGGHDRYDSVVRSSVACQELRDGVRNRSSTAQTNTAIGGLAGTAIPRSPHFNTLIGVV